MKNLKDTVLLLLSLLIPISCSDNEEGTGDNKREESYTSYYYYSYAAEDIISASDLDLQTDQFIPGPVYVQGDTLFIANIQENHYSVELYDRNKKKKIASIGRWDYQGQTDSLADRVEAIALSGDRLYLANIGSCIDVFDRVTLRFITRTGTRKWGENKKQMLHAHAMVATDGYLIVRTKNRLQVYREADVQAGTYQNVPFYSRGTKDGFTVNNGFHSYQMVKDTTGTVLLTDYGELGNRTIQAIDPAFISPGDNIALLDTSHTLSLSFHPCGIALYDHLLILTGNEGALHIYDREKKEFIQQFQSVSRYSFKKPEKLFIHQDELFISDRAARQLVSVRIHKNEIREY